MMIRSLTILGALVLGIATVGCDKEDERAKPDNTSKSATAIAPKSAAVSATATATPTPAPTPIPVATVTVTATASATASAPASAGHPAADAGPAAASLAKTAAQLDPAKLTEKAPATYKAKFSTSKGDFTVQVTRDLAPNGADRFYNLVKAGFYNDVRFFRVIEGFMVQFGINGDPAVNTLWRAAKIPDDPNKQSNKPGYITFATSGPNSRTTQVFINFGDNANLDGMGFSPFGQVIGDGMTVVNQLFKGYGEGAPRGRGPDQGRLQGEGNAYLMKEFPQMDWIKEAKIVP